MLNKRMNLIPAHSFVSFYCVCVVLEKLSATRTRTCPTSLSHFYVVIILRRHVMIFDENNVRVVYTLVIQK